MRDPRKPLLMVLATATALTGCSPDTFTLPMVGGVKHVGTSSGAPAPGYRVGVNATEDPVAYLSSIVEKPTPTLKDILAVKPEAPKADDQKEESDEDRLRIPALQETAVSYGARAGLSWNSRQINLRLRNNAQNLDRIYDFRKLMVRGPDGSMVMPPVISAAKDAYEMSEQGKSLRVADQVYEIVEQARFTPVAPMWHSYLIRSYDPPEAVPDIIRPRNARERTIWEEHVKKGWEAGIRQSDEIFESDLSRLERDFSGMVRYKKLLAEGKVSAPIVTKGEFGITGTGNDMRVNDRAIRIMKDPELQVNPQSWQPTISYKSTDFTAN